VSSLNSVVLEGTVAGEPCLRHPLKSGRAVCTFVLATERKRLDTDDEPAEKVSYFEVVARGQLAEAVGRHAKSGRAVRVMGWLKEDHWDGCDGKRRSKVSVEMDHIEWRPELSTAGRK
jgi:single-strand DNA-binding protein